MSMSVCVSVCPRGISGTTRVIFTKFFVHVAYVRGLVLLRHITCWQEGGNGSAQGGQSVIYDCRVDLLVYVHVCINTLPSAKSRRHSCTGPPFASTETT